MSLLTGFFKAIRHYGSQKALAKALGRSRQSITQWINRDEKITDLHAAIQLFTRLKGSIPLGELVENAEEIIRLLNSVVLFDKYPAVELSIDEIQITHGCPIYKATSQIVDIYSHDLSLPVLVDNDNQLITCECRIRASAISKQKKIFVHRIDLMRLINKKISITALLDMLPISEQVAIGLAIEKALGKRQGKRSPLPVIYPEVEQGLETREIAAKNTGFGSEFIYRQAKFVVKNGIPDLIKSMDQKVLRISKARQIANLSQDEQRQYLRELVNKNKQTCKNPHRRDQ